MTVPSARVVGLTGGIASGKSTVASMLRELGAQIVDADQVARDVVEPGSPALADIVERFGPEILTSSGHLDRKRLGVQVFSDPEARRDLEAITHPRIAQASQQAIAAHIAAGEPIVIYEAALIVENQLHKGMQGLIVVSIPVELQTERLMARDGIDRSAAAARIGAQMSLADKCRVATHVIDNSGSLAETRRQVEQLWEKLG